MKIEINSLVYHDDYFYLVYTEDKIECVHKAFNISNIRKFMIEELGFGKDDELRKEVMEVTTGVWVDEKK